MIATQSVHSPGVKMYAVPKSSVLVFLIFLLAGTLYSQTMPNVAVTPFSGDNNVTADQLEFITSKFSGELIKTNAFKVLDRGKMEFILKEQGFQQSGACNSSECKVQMGQLLGVDNMVAGKLVRFGGTYALHLEYIDVATGEISHTVDTEQRGELEFVYKDLCSGAAQNLQVAVSGKPASKPVATVVTPVVTPVEGTLVEEKPVVPADAIPKSDSKPMSVKRKIAMALWGASLAGVGAGYWFNGQCDTYGQDYQAAINAQNAADTKAAYDNVQTAELSRNASYGISVGTLVAGAVLWFWPEGN